MHPAVNRMIRAALICALLPMCILGSAGSHAQVSASGSLSPPVNHESGRIEQILTARDGAFQYRAYVLSWRNAHIVIADASEETHAIGDPRDVVVYRTEVNGRKVLRFEAAQSTADAAAELESSSTSAAITLGTARIDEIVSAEVDGYRFVAYALLWHDQHVMVVDPRADSTKAIGDTLDFKVFHTGVGSTQRLIFGL
jgi:hypothetical protein